MDTTAGTEDTSSSQDQKTIFLKAAELVDEYGIITNSGQAIRISPNWAFGWRFNYLWVDRHAHHVTLTLASGASTHSPHFNGHSYAADFNADGSYGNVYEIIINPHIVHKGGMIHAIRRTIEEEIDTLYEYGPYKKRGIFAAMLGIKRRTK